MVQNHDSYITTATADFPTSGPDFKAKIGFLLDSTTAIGKGEYRFLFSRIGIGISHYGPGIGIGQYLTLSRTGISQVNPIRLTGIIPSLHM